MLTLIFFSLFGANLNKIRGKGRGRRLAVFDVCTFALLYTIVNYAKMVYEMPNWQCVLACRSF